MFYPICQSTPNTIRRMMRNDWNDYVTRKVKWKTWQSVEQSTSPPYTKTRPNTKSKYDTLT